MNKRQLVIAAIATALSVSAANASNISGFSQTSGTFDINPAKVNGDVGYRSYDNFTLSQGDVANLIYRYQSGTASQRDIETFVNLVKNQIDINGIVNSVRDGKFYDGHAVFVSPNGMVVGASGVINVGTLSAITPTSSQFDSLKSEYDSNIYTNINQISQLKKTGNAPINIKGYIFAKNGIDLPANNITVSGNIVSGMTNQSKMTSLSQAESLFNQLVNTDGTIKANSSVINPNGTLVFLHQTGSTGGINVSGKVVNLTKGDAQNGSIAFTNNGSSGLTVSGKVAANGKLSMYNKAGNMNLSGSFNNKDGELALTNSAKAANLTIASSAIVKNANGDVSIINNGTGVLTNAGNVTAAKDLAIVNEAGSGMSVAGANDAETVRIVNRGNGLDIAGSADATKSVSVRNYGKDSAGAGIKLSGSLSAKEGVLVDNHAGSAAINGDIEVEAGNAAIENRSTATSLSTGANSSINVTKGNIAIQNEGAQGMTLNGDLNNDQGEIAINNHAGAMTVNGVIANNKGNMGIINKGTGKMTVGADVYNNGKLKVANVSGSAFEIKDTIANENGNFNIYNESGELTIDGDVSSTNGYLYILSRKASKGITATDASSITAKNGNLAIKHNGSDVNAKGYGLDLNGTVMNTTNQVAINNYKGNMHVGGVVAANADLGIINRAGSQNLTVDADIDVKNTVTNIKNDGSGNMTVAGNINHDGRLNILGNKGSLTLDGSIVNSGDKMTYATSRANGTGLTATSNFNATSDKGLVLIKNISGNNGLVFNGTINAGNAQGEVYSYKGNMTVNGSIQGTPGIILNTGNKLTVSSSAKLDKNSSIVNTGSVSADVAQQYKGLLKEKIKK